MENKKTGILDLPTEILQAIILHLDVKDILSCAKVCKKLWISTNRDFIWNPLCQRFCDKSAQFIDFVNSMPTTVDPVNSPPQEVLDSVCEWRKVYMKLIQLRRNFLNGVYNSQLVTCSPDDDRQLILANGLLLLENEAGDGLEAWNVRGRPRLVGMVMGAVTDVPARVVRVDDNIIIVVQGSLLQVYKINVETGDVSCMYRRLIHGDNNSDIPELDQINDWYEKQQMPKEITICVTGKYFICAVRLDGRHKLYQWNINTGQQVCESDISASINGYTDFTSVKLSAPETYSGEILLFLYKINYDYVTWIIFRYDVESFIYKYFLKGYSIDIPFLCYENNTIVIIIAANNQNTVYLYNMRPRYSTTPFVISHAFGTMHTFVSFRMFNNIISYIFGPKLVIKSYSFVDIYQVLLVKNNKCFQPSYLLGDWNILLVSFHDTSVGIGLIELHDLKAKCCLKTFDCQGLAIAYFSPSTFIVLKESHLEECRNINVLKFW